MSDLAGYLPFSQRPRRDESGVTGDWRPMTALSLGLVGDLLGSVPAAELARSSLRPGISVADAAVLLTLHLESSRRQILLARILGLPSPEPPSPPDPPSTPSAPPFPGRSVDLPSAPPREPWSGRSPDRPAEGDPVASSVVARLRRLAAARAAGHGRRGVGDLAEVVLFGFDAASSLDRPLVLPSIATGAVALARSLSAPVPIRSIVRSRTLVATDADWSVGAGPPIAGRAQELILFLYGRAGLPGTARP